MSTPASGTGSLEVPESDSGASDDRDASVAPTPDTGVSGEPDAQEPKPDEDDAGSCREKITGCDPIRKTGCAVELQMQCDVDLLAATPTGVCVFYAPSLDPNACLYLPPTESCPAGQTCVEAKCQAICLCDSECGAGKCCNKPVGAGGFKVCIEC